MAVNMATVPRNYFLRAAFISKSASLTVSSMALGSVGQISEAMGWSIPYTIGVLTYWKMAPFYCQAVLSYDQRITLDGAPAEPVDAEAKELATKQLAKLAARKAAKQTAAAKPKPKRKPVPTTEKSTQLRDRVRAGLLRRRRKPPPRKARQRPSRARGGAFPGRDAGRPDYRLRIAASLGSAPLIGEPRGVRRSSSPR
jgi:hypothetical protein